MGTPVRLEQLLNMKKRKMRVLNSCLVLAGSALLLQACGANPGNPLTVYVKNDTSQAVMIRACNGYGPSCKSVAYTAAIKPGARTSTAQEPDGTPRPIMVTAQSGEVLGCLPFQFSKVTPPNLTIDVSRMVPCGRTLGAKRADGRDWPFSRY
jgi:hypothetical protein